MTEKGRPRSKITRKKLAIVYSVKCAYVIQRLLLTMYDNY